MTGSLLELLVLAFIGSVAGLIGGVIFLIKDNWARALSDNAVPLAAGVLLSVSLLDLLPEATEKIGNTAFVYVLTALLVSFFFELYFANLHHHEQRRETMRKTSIPLVIFGDTIHNFIDGIAIGAAFITNPSFGLVIAFATFLHETPHEIGDFGILISSGWSRSKTFMANLLSASATFPGALLVYFGFQGADKQIGALLAISAGVFLYLGATDFLPELGEERGKQAWKKFLLLVSGAIIIYVVTAIVPKS